MSEFITEYKEQTIKKSGQDTFNFSKDKNEDTEEYKEQIEAMDDELDLDDFDDFGGSFTITFVEESAGHPSEAHEHTHSDHPEEIQVFEEPALIGEPSGSSDFEMVDSDDKSITFRLPGAKDYVNDLDDDNPPELSSNIESNLCISL